MNIYKFKFIKPPSPGLIKSNYLKSLKKDSEHKTESTKTGIIISIPAENLKSLIENTDYKIERIPERLFLSNSTHQIEIFSIEPIELFAEKSNIKTIKRK